MVNIIVHTALHRVENFPLARQAKGKKCAWVARYGLLGWRDLLYLLEDQHFQFLDFAEIN